MTIEAKLPDGTTLLFPDETDPAVIQSKVKEILGQPVSEVSEVSQESVTQESTQPTQDQINELNKAQMDGFSAIEKMKYEFDTTESFLQNADIAAEAWMPIGRIDLFNTAGKGLYASPTELYGNDFMDLNLDQRRERIQKVRYQKQIQEYPELTRLAESGQSTGGAGFLGALGGALADPTTFLPVGQSYKAMAGIGGLVAGSFEAARGLAEEGEIDLQSTLGYTVGGAVLTPAAVKAFRTAAPLVSKKVSPAFNKLKAKVASKKNPNTAASAEETMDLINSKMMELKASGSVEDEGLLLAASKRLGLTGDQVENAVINSNTKLDIPWNIEVDKVVLDTKVALNSASAVKNDLANKLITTTIRKVKQYSPAVAQRLQKFEMDSSVKSQEMMQRIRPFQIMFSKLSKDVQTEFTKRLKNKDWAGATKLAEDAGISSITTKGIIPTGKTSKGSFVVNDGQQKYTMTVEETMKQTKDVLNDMHMYGNEAFENGLDFLEGYFPRGKILINELLHAFGDVRTPMYKAALKREAKKLNKQSIDELTVAQKAAVFTDLFEAPIGRSAVGGFSSGKQRVLETLDDDLLQFYPDNASDALTNYINNTINHVEKYKFFKGNKTKVGDGKKFDASKSVGSMLRELQSEGKVIGDIEELTKIVNLRFNEGEKTPARFFQQLRSVASSLLLGNPASAFIQFADQLTNIYRYGGDGGKAILQTVLGRNVQNTKDFGLANHIATDLSDIKGFAKSFQDTLFKYSGFRAVDRFGKNSLIQGAWNKGTRLVKSEKGLKKFKEQWGETFGDEFDSLVNDLKAGKVTENTKLLLWNELSGSQPISLSDMPQSYLSSPNGRIFYQLKSFTLKQIQLLQDSVYDEAKKGNFKTAGKNALAYTVIVGGGQSVVQEARNAIRGRGFETERIPDHLGNYALSMMGTSLYGLNQLEDLEIKKFALSSLTPAILTVADFAADQTRILDELILQGYDWSDLDKKNFKSFPGVGDMYYNFFGGGIEDFLEREEKRKD